MSEQPLPEIKTSPPTQRPKCLLFEGLCNRINCLASAFLVSPSIDIYWAVNRHCAVRFDELFRPFKGTRVASCPVEHFCYVQSTDVLCWYYLCNPLNLPASEYVAGVRAAYRRVVAHLRHRPDRNLPLRAAAVCCRTLLPQGSGDAVRHFVPKMNRWLVETQPTVVFVVADRSSTKRFLVDRIRKLGFQTVTIECPLLEVDLQRSPENVFGMSKELIWLSQCDAGIFSNSARSTVTDSARGFGVPVIHTYGSNRNNRQPEINNWLNQSSHRPA